MIASRKRALIGALTGAVGRGCALVLYAVPLIEKIPTEWIFILIALAPTVMVGAIVGAIAGSQSGRWRGTIVGALLSVATFALLSRRRPVSPAEPGK